MILISHFHAAVISIVDKKASVSLRRHRRISGVVADERECAEFHAAADDAPRRQLPPIEVRERFRAATPPPTTRRKIAFAEGHGQPPAASRFINYWAAVMPPPNISGVSYRIFRGHQRIMLADALRLDAAAANIAIAGAGFGR